MGIIHGELQPLLRQKNDIFILDTKNEDFSPPLGGGGQKANFAKFCFIFPQLPLNNSQTKIGCDPRRTAAPTRTQSDIFILDTKNVFLPPRGRGKKANFTKPCCVPSHPTLVV